MERTRDGPTSRPGRLDDMSVSRRSSLSVPATLTRSPRTGETNPHPTNSVYAPPSDPRDPSAPLPTDLRHLVAAFLLAAAIPLGLFVASYPLVGAVGLATLVGLFAGRRRAGATLRRLQDRPLQFDLPGGVRLRVVRHPAERPPRTARRTSETDRRVFDR